jgi:hypothetical protein
MVSGQRPAVIGQRSVHGWAGRLLFRACSYAQERKREIQGESEWRGMGRDAWGEMRGIVTKSIEAGGVKSSQPNSPSSVEGRGSAMAEDQRCHTQYADRS